LADSQSSPLNSGLDSGRDYKRQRAFIVNRDFCIFHFKSFEDSAGLLQNGVAVAEGHPRLECNLDAAAVARFDGDVQIGPNVFAPVPCIGRLSRDGCRGCHLHHLQTACKCSSAAASASTFLIIVSAICEVGAAPWLITLGPPGSRIMS